MNRWWAPQRATLEPDAVVKALLVPGGDASGDLGSSLLAAHRAGAAACETVARGAVPNEVGLIQAMATVRAQFAGPVVEMVSKSLGDQTSYPDLLVRDLLDDAEMGALTLFRTAVSKGVPPPMAAQRAGAVYGVPYQQMGKYAALANDPRANPVALTDAADRALLTYVSKVVAAEIDPAQVSVSKQRGRPAASPDRDFNPQEHPRDQRTGQFVQAPPREGPPVREAEVEAPAPAPAPAPAVAPYYERLRERLGLGAAPTVAGEEAIEVAPPPTTTPTPTRRAAPRGRRGRRTRKQLPAPAPTQAAPARTEVARPQVGRLRAGRLKAAPLRAARLTAAQIQATAQAAGAQAAPEAPTPIQDMVRGTAMEIQFPQASRADYHALESITLLADAQQGMDLRKKMLGRNTRMSPRIFRMSHLVDIARDAETTDSHSDSQARAGLAADLRAAQGSRYIDPVVFDPASDPELLQRIEAGFDSIQENREFYRKVGQERLASHKVTLPDGREVNALDADEVNNVETAIDYDTGEVILVHRQQQPGKGASDVRPRPAIDEYVFEDEAQGYSEGRPGRLNYTLSPNQAYALKDPASITLYDRKNKVFVNRWYVKPIDEDQVDDYLNDLDVSKALQGGDAIQFAQQHPRDAHGRFVQLSERTTTVAPTATPAPVRAPEADYLTRLRERALGKPAVEEEVQPPAQPTQRRAAPRGRRGRRQRRVRAIAPTVAAGQTTQQVQPLQAAPLRAGRLRAAPMTPAARILAGVRAKATEEALNKPEIRLRMLHDWQNYKVLTAEDYDLLLRALPRDAQARLTMGGLPVPIYGGALQHFMLHEELSAEDAIDRIHQNLDQQILEDTGFERGFGQLQIIKTAGPDDVDKVSEAVDHLFTQYPTLSAIDIEGPDAKGVWRLYGTKVDAKDQILIEVDPDLDFAKPVELVPLGLYRTREMVLQRIDTPTPEAIVGDSETRPMNAPIQRFRIRNASTQRYRANQLSPNPWPEEDE